jgi:hypothetical protein
VSAAVSSPSSPVQASVKPRTGARARSERGMEGPRGRPRLDPRRPNCKGFGVAGGFRSARRPAVPTRRPLATRGPAPPGRRATADAIGT